MWHHFELTHSQQLAVQRRVALSTEEWNYLQLSVIGAASAISLIVSTISQRWTNGDGLVGTYLPPHSVCGLVVRIGSYVFEISRNCWFQAWAGERWYLAGRSPLQSGSPGFCVLTNALGLVGFWKLRPCLVCNGDNLRGKLKKWVKAALLSGDCEKCRP